MWKLKNTWSSAAIPSAIRFWAHFSAFLSSITYFITCNEEQISAGSYQDAKHVIKQHPWCYELRYRTLYIQYFCSGGRGWVELCSGFLLVQAPINLKQQNENDLQITGCYINKELASSGCQSFKHHWPSAGSWKRNRSRTTAPEIAGSSRQQLLLALSAPVFHNSWRFLFPPPQKANKIHSLGGSDQSAPRHALEWSAQNVIHRVKPTSERRQTITKQPANANWPASSLLPAIYWIAYHRPENMIGCDVQQNSVRARKQEEELNCFKFLIIFEKIFHKR